MIYDPERHDLRLVERMLDGNEDAFNEFVAEYHPRLFRFACRRLGGDLDGAADVVQATFEKVLPKLNQFRGEAALFSWMCSFCRFEIAAHWRSQGRHQVEVELVEDAPEVQAALESLAALEEGHDVAFERHELAQLVRTVLDYLPLRYAQALEWKYLADVSVREIAARLRMTPKAAESMLTRARSAFRDGFAAVVGGAVS